MKHGSLKSQWANGRLFLRWLAIVAWARPTLKAIPWLTRPSPSHSILEATLRAMKPPNEIEPTRARGPPPRSNDQSGQPTQSAHHQLKQKSPTTYANLNTKHAKKHRQSNKTPDTTRVWDDLERHLLKLRRISVCLPWKGPLHLATELLSKADRLQVHRIWLLLLVQESCKDHLTTYFKAT